MTTTGRDVHGASEPARSEVPLDEPATASVTRETASARPTGRLASALGGMDPGWFALVMASGIVSIGTDLLGDVVLSRLILAVTVVGFVVLGLAYVARMVIFTGSFRLSLRDPSTSMGYFTVVAGTDVLATRVAMSGHPLVSFSLGAAGAVIWLVLTYGLPWSIVVAANQPVLRQINGTWLIWVVATQSLSIVAAAVSAAAPSTWLRNDLPAVALCLWGVGVMLYVVLIVIIFLRLLLVEVTPAEMGPAYWIAMGATAISVRAAAGILVLHGAPAAELVGEMRPFLIGLSVVLWAFGTWWIPLLVAFGVWRYVVRNYSWAFEPRLWSVVFPIGMYTVASYTMGHAAALGFMASVARMWLFVGVAAWAAVLGLMLFAAARASRRPRPKEPLA